MDGDESCERALAVGIGLTLHQSSPAASDLMVSVACTMLSVNFKLSSYSAASRQEDAKRRESVHECDRQNPGISAASRAALGCWRYRFPHYLNPREGQKVQKAVRRRASLTLAPALRRGSRPLPTLAAAGTDRWLDAVRPRRARPRVEEAKLAPSRLQLPHL